MDLAEKFRPKSLTEVVGQPEAVSILQGWLNRDEVPHVVMFTGLTGAGKTTLARILAKNIGCGEIQSFDCADNRGIDFARELKTLVAYPPMQSERRAIILDEVVQLPKQTQQVMLTLLEKPPAHSYFFLCTSVMTGLLKPFLNRCKRIEVEPISTQLIADQLQFVCKSLKRKVDGQVLSVIARDAGGSMREALSVLELVLAIPSNTADDFGKQLSIVKSAKVDEESDNDPKIKLCRLLMRGTPAVWGQIATILEELNGEQPETVRFRVLVYMNKVMRNGWVPRAAACVDEFQYKFDDVGHAGLTRACMRVCARKID